MHHLACFFNSKMMHRFFYMVLLNWKYTIQSFIGSKFKDVIITINGF